ncbi:cytochrome P450 6j1-like [Phlebotomus argentipes]|uniref:cytochrome P450 6j1-like n=1 Tax=Phlebotomus argentipes TaxID=94469 RepID=UPI002893368D|nr:cytochrome P450 6j1-like [Phlebotomus argentipes]
MLPYILLSAIVAIYLYFKWHLSFFERRGIAGPKPLPFIGNMWDYVTGKKHFGHVFGDIYRSYPNANYVGIYKMHKPAVLVKDLDLVKDVIVGDFSSFHDNDFTVNPKLDPLLSINPFFASGEDWKNLRAQISPIFTFSKVKACFPIMNGVCNTLVDWIKNGPKAGNSDGIEVKSLGEMYTMDVVASAAFGVEAQSFTSVITPFRELLLDMISPTVWNSIKMFFIRFQPQLVPILGIPLVSKKHSDWVRSFVDKVIQRRKDLGEKRQDLLQNFLDLLKKTENGNLAKYSKDLIAGQSLLFLTEGTETSSMLISFALYQLARNPDIAKRAQEEVDSVYERHGGKLTEEGVTEMEYLEQILFETLRLHSVIFIMARVASRDYIFPPQFPGSSERLVIPKGTIVVIPVNAIHYDSAYHPDPYTFNPDRFSEEGRKERNRYTFMGFGEGPRICIGQKFGLFQVKAAISSILRNFNISLNKKTREPLQISKKSFLPVAEGGIWVNFSERNIVK